MPNEHELLESKPFELSQKPERPPNPRSVMEEAGAFKDAFKTRCRGCTSMLAVPLPMVHCPACHYVWRAKKLTSPSRCARCNFNLWQWRQMNRVADQGNEGALRA